MKNTSLCLTAACLAAALHAPAGAARAPATPALAPDKINNAGKDATAATKAVKPSSAALLRAQVLLDRARFSPGEIDGASGSNMKPVSYTHLTLPTKA